MSTLSKVGTVPQLDSDIRKMANMREQSGPNPAALHVRIPVGSPVSKLRDHQVSQPDNTPHLLIRATEDERVPLDVKKSNLTGQRPSSPIQI